MITNNGNIFFIKAHQWLNYGVFHCIHAFNKRYFIELGFKKYTK